MIVALFRGFIGSEVSSVSASYGMHPLVSHTFDPRRAGGSPSRSSIKVLRCSHDAPGLPVAVGMRLKLAMHYSLSYPSSACSVSDPFRSIQYLRSLSDNATLLPSH